LQNCPIDYAQEFQSTCKQAYAYRVESQYIRSYFTIRCQLFPEGSWLADCKNKNRFTFIPNQNRDVFNETKLTKIPD